MNHYLKMLVVGDQVGGKEGKVLIVNNWEVIR